MIIAILKVYKTGMITLPKQWRDRYPSHYVTAEETPAGLLIRPISDEGLLKHKKSLQRGGRIKK